MSLDEEAKKMGKRKHRGAKGTSEKWDQFLANKKLYNVTGAYSEDDYNPRLDRNTEWYKRNERMASKLAREIQSQNSDNLHLAEERGLVQPSEAGMPPLSVVLPLRSLITQHPRHD